MIKMTRLKDVLKKEEMDWVNELATISVNLENAINKPELNRVLLIKLSWKLEALITKKYRIKNYLSTSYSMDMP